MMHKESDELPVEDGGNGERLRTLVYDACDAPMLAHAMMLASTRAMLSGVPDAQRRLQFYRRQFAESAPESSEAFGDAEFCEMAVAIGGAREWRLDRMIQPGDRLGHAVVSMGERTWRTARPIDGARHAAIARLLEAISPLDCVGVVAQEEKEDAW